MAQVLQGAIDKKAGASKRSSDAAANAAGLATSAAAVAASKRSRASLSSGPVVGPDGLAAAFARQGDTLALADMIHSEGLLYFCILPKFEITVPQSTFVVIVVIAVVIHFGLL